ncbi:helix-turn-helix domain-containing protein [Chryseobacterium wanjuense]
MVDQLFDASIQNKPINSIETLSEREYNVFVLLAKGLGNLEISNLLEVQMPTISTYKRRIYSKLKVTNLAELINLI